jgi:hypothetical protein
MHSSYGLRDDRAQWVQWRAGRMERAGFPADVAARLARQDRVELHALLELIDRGCPPQLAARILAPLDAPVTKP